jgi:hypothetical protein
MGPAEGVPKSTPRPSLSIVNTIDSTVSQEISVRGRVVCLFHVAVMIPLAMLPTNRRVLIRRKAQRRNVPRPTSHVRLYELLLSSEIDEESLHSLGSGNGVITSRRLLLAIPAYFTFQSRPGILFHSWFEAHSRLIPPLRYR